ncbi:FtsW/RodA/SpoVE family cell cycle protein [Coprothermobacteraceae bacterium]|nr:FtsW/RodA/SpoVE family cell cycle protein [Coprothermobacteraceae bacterium]
MKWRAVFIFSSSLSAFLLTAAGFLGVAVATQTSYSLQTFITRPVVTQFAALIIGVFLGLIVIYAGFRYWLRVAPYLLVATFALLVVVLLVGHEAYGAQRWIRIGFFQFQPSEVAKLTYALFLAWCAYRFSGWKKWALVLPVSLGLAGLILVQPDLGTTIVVLGELVAFMIAENVNWGVLLGGLYGGLLVFPTLWEKGLKDYQRQRLLSFLNPFKDASGSGYNLVQALTAIGSGQFSGVGLEKAYFIYYGYLPVAQADFIFATLAHVWGFLGAVGLLLALFVFLLSLLAFAHLVPDPIHKKFSYVMLAAWFLQVTVNVGMNLGLLPITGIPLPFVSYGGSALLVNVLALFMVLSYRPEPEVH